MLACFPPEAALARAELVPFPVLLVARGSKLTASPHARLRLAGRTNASVPTRSISHSAYFFPCIRASNSSSRAELQNAIFQAADPHGEHVAEIVLTNQPRRGCGLLGQIG